MQIDFLENKKPDSRYLEGKVIQILEDHLTDLKNDTGNTLLPVTEHLNYKYEGDLYGLLNELSIIPKYHYITMRINGLENSTDYKGDLPYVIFPNTDTIDLIVETTFVSVI